MVGKIIFIGLLFLSFQTQAQIKFFEQYNSAGSDKGEGIVELPDTSYMICGTSTSFFNGAPQAFLMKIDSVGKHLWAKQYGGLETETAKRIFHTANEGFYVFGETNTTPTGDYQIYVFHTDDSGALIWEKNYGTNSWDILHDAIKLPDSSYVLIGETYGTADGETDGYILRLDKNGDTLFTIQTNFPGEDRFQGVVNYYDTAFAVGGKVWNSDSNYFKAYIAVYALDGTLFWDQQYGDSGNYEILDIEKNNGDILGVGYRLSPIDNLADDYGLHLDAQGSVVFTFSYPFEGSRSYEKITSYGNQNRFYLGLTNDDQFTSGPGKDAYIDDFSGGLFSFNNGVDIDGSFDDDIGQILATSDNGAIVVGTNRDVVAEIPNVYVLKIGANQNYPNTLLPTIVQSLVEITELDQELNTSNLFPNPASDFLHFKSDLIEEGSSIVILNIEGQIVMKTPRTQKDLTLDVSGLTPGLYFVSLESKSGVNRKIGKVSIR